MAPRHAEMGRHSIQDAPSDFVDDDPYEDEAFDPFDTTDHDGEDFGGSFAAEDFDDVEFPEPEAAPQEPQRQRKAKAGRSRRSSSVAGRGSSSRRKTMEEGGGRRDSTRRMGESSRRDSTRRMGDSSRGLDDSVSSSRMDDGSLSKSVPDGPRRRARMSQQRTPKPARGPSFPKNTARRSSSATTLEKQSSSSRMADGSGHKQARRSVSDDGTSTPRSATTSKSRNRRSSTATEGSEGAPLSPGSGATSRRSSATGATRSPRDRSSRRVSISNSDARLRIRKEAALQREREHRENEEAKIAAQKAKLAKQKQKTDDMLGRKLAKLDSMDGSEDADGKSVNSKGGRSDLNGSIHSAGTRGSTVDQRRRHRRTHLSHNILVRNMNQMAQASKLQDSIGSFGGDDTEYDLDEITEETEEMSIQSSSAELNGKKEAWQRRRERQQRTS